MKIKKIFFLLLPIFYISTLSIGLSNNNNLTINYSHEINKFNSNKKNENVLEIAFNRLLLGIRFQKIIDLSDLNISQDNVVKIYAYIINNLTALFPYLPPPQQNMPKNFFNQQTPNDWNGLVDPRPKSNDIKKTIAVSNEMSKQMFDILKFMPKTNDSNDYIYWAYSFIANWITYSKIGLDTKLFLNALLYKKGVCESYAKMSQLFFNIIGIDAVYQTGELKSGITSGPHIWNKYKVGNNWFNFDTTSAATAVKAYYKLPIGDFLAFSDNDFGTKRTKYPTWYESSKLANYDTSKLLDYVPFRKDLNNKKWVYKNKWYYFDQNTMEIVESNIDNTNRRVIKKVNRDFLINNISANNCYLVGNCLYWVDKNNNNDFVVSEYNLDNTSLNIDFKKLNFSSNEEISSTKLDNLNELSITTSSGNNEKILINDNYNFFTDNKSIYSQRSIATILSLYFIQFEIGNKIGQIKDESTYLKHQSILVKGLLEKNYDEKLYNDLINFKKNLENDLNKENIVSINVSIDNNKVVNEHSELVIEPNLILENIDESNLSFQWQKQNGNDWVNIDNQINKILKIDDVNNAYNNCYIRLVITSGEKQFFSNECLVVVNELPIPIITLKNETNKSEWNIGDDLALKIDVSSFENLSEITLYKKIGSNTKIIGNIEKNQSFFYYKVLKEDLLNSVDFFIECNFFNTKIQSNSVNVIFNPKIKQLINGENIQSLNNLNVNSVIQLEIVSDIDSFNYQWDYNEKVFKIISHDDNYRWIRLEVISNSINEIIECLLTKDTFSKVIDYNLKFSNNTINDKNNNKIDKGLIIGISIGCFFAVVVIVLIILIIIKKKKNNIK